MNDKTYEKIMSWIVSYEYIETNRDGEQFSYVDSADLKEYIDKLKREEDGE